MKRKPEVRIGKVTGTVRLHGKALGELRRQVFERDNYRCTWEGCGKHVPMNGDLYTRGHMAHIKSRGAGGGDTLDNCRILCSFHHLECEHLKGERG